MGRLRICSVALLALAIGWAVTGCAAFQDDQFDGKSLGSRWTVVDPVGDGRVTVGGGSLKLTVPSGTNHDNWPNLHPVNRTLRVVQDLVPGDWTVETRILNTDVDDGRFAGLLVEADDGNFFRSDWDGDGTNVALYVGLWSGGPSFVPKYDVDVGNQAVQWQRIAKVGTAYTVSTSTDGSSWVPRVTFSWGATPTKIGLNVGNSGATPAYTAKFDYFLRR